MEVISGNEEAKIVYESHIADRLDPAQQYLYVDVGGGSTETTLIEKRRMIDSQSFNIGTLRILAGKIKDGEWEKLDAWLETISIAKQPLEIIASGGNINKLYRMAKPGRDGKMSLSKLRKIYTRLKKTKLEDRIANLGLRPDRADVIIPAAEIFLHIAEKTGVKLFRVPSMGLADGIVHSLWRQWQANAKRE